MSSVANILETKDLDKFFRDPVDFQALKKFPLP